MDLLNPRAKDASLNRVLEPSVPSRLWHIPTEKALCYRAESFFYRRYLWDIGPGGVAYDGQVKIGQKG